MLLIKHGEGDDFGKGQLEVYVSPDKAQRYGPGAKGGAGAASCECSQLLYGSLRARAVALLSTPPSSPFPRLQHLGRTRGRWCSRCRAARSRRQR